jgi:hypothetical protein
MIVAAAPLGGAPLEVTEVGGVHGDSLAGIGH